MNVMFGHIESEVSFEIFKRRRSVIGFTDLELREDIHQRYIYIYNLHVGGF